LESAANAKGAGTDRNAVAAVVERTIDSMNDRRDNDDDDAISLLTFEAIFKIDGLFDEVTCCEKYVFIP